MRRLAHMSGLLFTAATFVWLVPLTQLFAAFQPMVVGLSIMIAAVFVRLNRGMPTLDWKSLEVTERTRLTKAIVDLTKDYAWILAFLALTAVFIVGLTTVGRGPVRSWHPAAVYGVSGLIGALLFECFWRMAYVVWRDFDVVKLQKHLIDASGERDHSEQQGVEVDAKVAAMKSSGLRAPPSNPPTGWH